MDAGTILSAYGLPGLVIFVMAGVIVYQEKAKQRLYERLDTIQDQRLTDAKETRDKLTDPLERQAALSEKIYEFLLSGKRGS